MPRVLALLAFVLLSLTAGFARADVVAASCTETDVTAAVATAKSGDTVAVPAGACSWTAFSLAKAVNLKGAGVGKTTITLLGKNRVTKQADGVTRIVGFSFSNSGGGNANKGFLVDGSWKNAQPVVFQNDAFTTQGSGLFLIEVAGGVIFAYDSFTGLWDDSFLQIKSAQDPDGSWKTADSMGARDTNGTLNHYIETNVFVGGTNQGIDCDDACRVVYRHNTLTNSSFNSHGDDTSPTGIRHFEIYNNNFGNTRDATQLANENQAIWIRGATGVVYDNNFADLAGSSWGTKPEVRLSNRGAEDNRPQGACGMVSYPTPHQLGQNNDGMKSFTDPIYFWGNTGALRETDGFNWGNPCGLTWSTFFQWGRDAMNQSLGGGSPKPGYVAYTYPHPLLAAPACNSAQDCTAAPTCTTQAGAACTSGVCVYPQAPVGTACDNAAACSGPATCNASGVCVASNACDGGGDGGSAVHGSSGGCSCVVGGATSAQYGATGAFALVALLGLRRARRPRSASNSS